MSNTTAAPPWMPSHAGGALGKKAKAIKMMAKLANITYGTAMGPGGWLLSCGGQRSVEHSRPRVHNPSVRDLELSGVGNSAHVLNLGDNQALHSLLN